MASSNRRAARSLGRIAAALAGCLTKRMQPTAVPFTDLPEWRSPHLSEDTPLTVGTG